MSRVHFVSAHFGGDVPWMPFLKSSKHQISFNYYNDNNYPSRHLSMHPRFKSKLPKMLEWKNVKSEWYVWMDSSIRPLEGIDLADRILQQVGDNPLCLFRHSKGNTIREEALRTINMLNSGHQYFKFRYSGEPILDQLIHYYGDPDFIDNKLFSTNFFAYHHTISGLMQEWFNQVVQWSLQCQISLPYVLHKSGVTYSLFDGYTNIQNNFFTWDWRTREKSLSPKSFL